ncbi:LysR family transcriptional regulator [Parahaliea mediterranea]|uniref:LysR family transcriptional regulator n=1 Tax=Parahaliea mediterranea TaxID=651086 RepID=A0A939IJ75_9GAMM|nr:LysR family transcriptional regulator [Parahaliea mediterranea]MBN7795991.1 LysR family transcriptional regulator [Parahaliea mediterranea]
MRLDKLDLNLFILFDALYQERSVTRVAVLLNLTQPAVSNALARLRQAFDDPLFVRTPDGMAPTPVADNIVGDVREALALLRRSAGVNARFDPATSEKTFRLGMNDLAEFLLLPGLRAIVSEQAPRLSISSYYVSRDGAAEELKAGRSDLLLDAPVFNARGLEQQRLGEFPYVVAMRRGHPLARRKLTEKAYLQGEHLHVSSRRRGRGQVDIALHNRGARRRVVMRVQNYLVAARIAQQTDLLWTVPRVLLPLLDLAWRPLPFAVEPLVWHLFWHGNAEGDPASRWMRERLQQLVTGVMAH